MPGSELEIYNLALGAIGTRTSVSSLTENSREREVCGLWYDITRDTILRAAWWPSVKKWARLALLAERTNFNDDWVDTNPGPQWTFAYALPSDMIAPRHLSTYGRFTIELYSPTSGSEVKALMTDDESPILQYSKRQKLVQMWDESLAMAVVYGLAANIAMPLTGKFEVALKMQEQANALVFRAREAVANDQVNQYETIAPWHAARGYAEAPPRTQFLYPYGPALSITSEKTAIRSGPLGGFPDAL